MSKLIKKYKAADKNTRHFIRLNDKKRIFKWANIARELLIKMVGETVWNEIYNGKYDIHYDVYYMGRTTTEIPSTPFKKYILVTPIIKYLVLNKRTLNFYPSGKICGHNIEYPSLVTIPIRIYKPHWESDKRKISQK